MKRPVILHADPNPVIPAYPICGECRTAFVLRRCFRFTDSTWLWLWQRDCKHRDADPEVVEE